MYSHGLIRGKDRRGMRQEATAMYVPPSLSPCLRSPPAPPPTVLPNNKMIPTISSHQEDDILVSGFSDVLGGFQVSGNLETWKPGNLHGTTQVLAFMYIKDEEKN
jgi:hypothetical protein